MPTTRDNRKPVKKEDITVVYNGYERLGYYVTSPSIKSKLIALGIEKAYSHKKTDELTPNTIALYTQLCARCKSGTTGNRGVYRINGRIVTLFSGCADAIFPCSKHIEVNKATTIKDDDGTDIAYYFEKDNFILVPNDLSHETYDSSVTVFNYILDKIIELQRADTMSFEALVNKALIFSKVLDSENKNYADKVKSLKASNEKFSKEFNERISKAREEAVAKEEERIKKKYSSLFEKMLKEKEEEVQKLRDRFSNAIAPNYDLLSELEEKDYSLMIIDRQPQLVKKVKLKFTHSSSFGMIVKKIEPPIEMDIYISVVVSPDFSRVTNFNAYLDICPVIDIYGVHFQRTYICLGDSSGLISTTKMTAESIENAVEELLDTLSNLSFEHGCEPDEDDFPARVMDLWEEYEEYRNISDD